MNNKFKIEKFFKKSCIGLLLICLVFSVTGCKSNPDSIIKNKDMDELIDKAGSKDSGDIGMDELLSNYDTYKATVKDDSLGVTVNIDAKVSIPKTDKMSVIRVAQQTISDELLSKVIKELAGNTKLYDGSILLTRTKKQIEGEIKFYRDELNNISSDVSEKEKKQLRNEYQKSIDNLENEYKSAPSTLNIKNNPSDYKLHSVSAEYNKNSKDPYYSWMYSMDNNIDSFYGVNDGEDKNYISLSALNSPDYGNRMIYRSGNHGYEFTSAIAGIGANEHTTTWQSENIPDDSKQDQASGLNYVKFPEDTVSLSRDEAINQAEDFLRKVGISGFKIYEGNVYTEQVDVRYNCDLEGIPCRTYYILKYMRNIDGAFVTPGGQEKYSESWNDNSYVKQEWPEESIVFRINDNGIVGFDYNVPIKTVETVVENSALKNFETIKQTFEKMVVIANAEKDTTKVINIDKVVLGYARISEKNSFDTGLLVPVWDFFGKIDSEISEKNGERYKMIMTINAIDGSIVDRQLGY